MPFKKPFEVGDVVGGGAVAHNSTTAKQGGGGGNFYHSDQPINTTDPVVFAGVVSNGTTKVNESDFFIDNSTNLRGCFHMVHPNTGNSDNQITFEDSGSVRGGLYYTTHAAQNALILDSTAGAGVSIKIGAGPIVNVSQIFVSPGVGGNVGINTDNPSTQFDINGIVTADNLPVSVALTGANYTDLKAALDASETNILITGDITETADVTLPVSLDINIEVANGVTLNMGVQRLLYASNDQEVGVKLNAGSSVTIANTSGAAASIFNKNSKLRTKFKLRGGLIDHNPTNAAVYISDCDALDIQDCKIELPNFSECGFRFTGVLPKNFNNVEFVGGGNDCTRILDDFGGDNLSMSSITASGTFKGSTSSLFIMPLGTTTIDSFNCSRVVTSDLTMTIGRLGIVDSFVGPAGYDIIFNNGAQTFSNSYFDSFSVSAPDIIIDNCRTVNGAVVNAAGDRCKIKSCYISSSGVGGTITINASADKVTIRDCFTDAAIVGTPAIDSDNQQF